jgi:hypothetical protein
MRYVIAFLLAATIAASPGLGQTLSGEWCGAGDQDGPGDFRSQWSASLMLQGPTGRMDYPSLRCGGTLAFEGVRGDVHLYRERLDHGHARCLDGGLVAVKIIGASVHWEWTGAGGVASAMLVPLCRPQISSVRPTLSRQRKPPSISMASLDKISQCTTQ